ncbi:hypothetical protein Hanom_Chr16g01496851 [Helianthus anomalus]
MTVVRVLSVEWWFQVAASGGSGRGSVHFDLIQVRLWIVRVHSGSTQFSVQFWIGLAVDRVRTWFKLDLFRISGSGQTRSRKQGSDTVQ